MRAKTKRSLWWTPETDTELKKLWAIPVGPCWAASNGKSISSVAKLMNRNPSTVRYHAKKLGITSESPRKPTRWANSQCEKWLRHCYESGWSEESLTDLKGVWWKYHNDRGALISPAPPKEADHAE